ncbi:MAG: ATP-dependent helicase [Bacteroidales bacterium]
MITDSLNDIQRQAAEQQKGPILIVAGAGSGKTRTLTYRIAHLLELGKSPYSIMALTFTNKAAKEMQERIVSLVGPLAKAILMGTFHSIFARILRIDGHRIGYASNFTIYDDDDSKRVVSSVIKDMNLDDRLYHKDKILKRISKAKCALYSPEDYKNNPTLIEADIEANIPLTHRIYAEYQRRLIGAMAMDFDDILFNMNVLLRDFEDILEKYQKRFQYILVDEYQDTNFAQYVIIKKLADYHRNICVVGDDAQSIYSFRGANVENILNFHTTYPDAQIYKLEQNYRSTKNIINAANSLIANNRHQIRKHLYTDNTDGDKVVYRTFPTDREEAGYVVDKIQSLVSNGQSYNDVAILYRTNSQSRSFEDCLRLKNIPYIIYGGVPFYGRKEIKDCVAYMRLVVNNDDDEAFERIINYPPRGIGQTTLDKLKLTKNQKHLSLFETSKQLQIYNPYNITNKSVTILNSFCLMIETFSQRVQTDNAYTLGSELIDRCGIINELNKLDKDDAKDRLDNIDELIGSVQSFVEDEQQNIVDALTGEEISIQNKTLDVFLQQVSLMSAIDVEQEQESDKVKLMTIHSSKGLEFDTVFVGGMEENLFPSYLTVASEESLEEERRLFYVAVTRAKKHLILTSAQLRYKFGQVVISETSRFVQEIDSKYLNIEDNDNETNNEKEINTPKKQMFSLRPKKSISSLLSNSLTDHRPQLKLNKKQEQKDWYLAPLGDLDAGVEVWHDKFGKGRIVNTYIEQGDVRAKVLFEDYENMKTLILKFAKLKIKRK